MAVAVGASVARPSLLTPCRRTRLSVGCSVAVTSAAWMRPVWKAVRGLGPSGRQPHHQMMQDPSLLSIPGSCVSSSLACCAFTKLPPPWGRGECLQHPAPAPPPLEECHFRIEGSG